MTIKELKEYGINMLKKANCPEASLKVKLLLGYTLGVTKEYLVTNDNEEVDSLVENVFYERLKKLEERVPLEYITHNKEFMKLNLYVDENVLIPRPDTEVLVEEVIKRCKENDNVLDLCTGSGAIAVSLAKYLNGLNITGIDISDKAIEIAKKNASTNNVFIDFYKSNLFENVKQNNWNVIVSNPPYIESNVINELEPEVRNEPKIALDGGEDGLDFYRKIIYETPYYLKNNGILALEIGYNQSKAVEKLIKKRGCYTDVETIKDLAGNDRVVICKIK